MKAEYLCGFQYPNLQLTPFGGQFDADQDAALESKMKITLDEKEIQNKIHLCIFQNRLFYEIIVSYG